MGTARRPLPAPHCPPLGWPPGPRIQGAERLRPQDSISFSRTQLLRTEMPPPLTKAAPTRSSALQVSACSRILEPGPQGISIN